MKRRLVYFRISSKQITGAALDEVESPDVEITGSSLKQRIIQVAFCFLLFEMQEYQLYLIVNFLAKRKVRWYKRS